MGEVVIKGIFIQRKPLWTTKFQSYIGCLLRVAREKKSNNTEEEVTN